MSVKSKLQHPPLCIPRAFDVFVFPGDGEFDPFTCEVGNLNCNLDFVPRVPVFERGLINQDAGRHAGLYGEFLGP